MNHRRVLHILGLVLLVQGGAQLVPLALCLTAGDRGAVMGFSVSVAGTVLLGLLFRAFGSRGGELYRREGVLIVVGAWLLASFSGAVPYFVGGAIPNPVDALFESDSGFTTTGASILRDIEALPRGVLFWRNFTQWLGGIGIVVLFVALLSELGPGARFLFKLEVTGPKAEVLHAHVRDTAISLSQVYLALTAAQVVALLALGLGLFDALTHTFSTVSTGGFSPYNASMAHFGAGAQLVVLVFMLASGVNLSLYYRLVRWRDLRVLRDVELRTYLGLVAAATCVVAISAASQRQDGGPGFAAGLLAAAFNVVSIVTTSGFATADFSLWPSLALSTLVALMVAGGCAGSTSGGAKLIRTIIAWKATLREVRLTFSPNSVIAVSVGGEAVPESSVRSVVALLVLWLFAWGVGAVLLSIGDVDIVTAATASITTLSNVGPGLAAVGPLGNFAFFADWQKLVMVALMLLGRLEFFALVSLFLPQFWRR